MALNFWKWLAGGKARSPTTVEITCRELMAAAQEFQLRDMSFWICANMIANAVGRCEFRTFRDGKEIREREHYLWNVEPNVNQNSTAFLHKLVAKLLTDGEALVISTRQREGYDALVVADSWLPNGDYPSRQNEYINVQVGDVSYEKTFREREVLHLKLNHINVKPVLDGLYGAYWRLISAAMKRYEWDKGQHWKVHVDQLASGAEDFTENFTRMIEQQVKTFLDSNSAILPEFDGYAYTNEGGKANVELADIQSQMKDVLGFTAKALQIPAVLVDGSIQGTEDAQGRFLTGCIDPICDQLQEEINRKRYGYDRMRAGDYLRVDTSSIRHFDMFANAANVEKLVGSGAFTINDVLRSAGLPTIPEPWADEHYMTKNIAALGAETTALGGAEGGNG
nr:MAG TPA: portal protein [Caudoviricetes sp.]